MSSDIGEDTARELAAEGAPVACLACREDRIGGPAGEIGGVALGTDVSEESATRAAVDEAAGSLGGLDAVLNVAARPPAWSVVRSPTPSPSRPT